MVSTFVLVFCKFQAFMSIIMQQVVVLVEHFKICLNQKVDSNE